MIARVLLVFTVLIAAALASSALLPASSAVDQCLATDLKLRQGLAANPAFAEKLKALGLTTADLQKAVRARKKDGATFNLKCWVCEHAIGKFIDFAVEHGCDAADPIADAACEAAGIGPEDPLADACAVALDAACGILVEYFVDDHIHASSALCDRIHWC